MRSPPLVAVLLPVQVLAWLLASTCLAEQPPSGVSLRGSAVLEEAKDHAEGRELQLTSVQDFSNSYLSGGRFNDTTVTRVNGQWPTYAKSC